MMRVKVVTLTCTTPLLPHPRPAAEHPLLAPVALRRHRLGLLEHAAKVGAALIANAVRDLGHRQLRFAQQRAGFLDADAVNVSDQRQPGNSGEEMAEVIRAEMKSIGEIA